MNSCKILVVEDDPSIRRVIMIALKLDGYTNIEEVTDGNEAVDMAFRFRPDLVLLDIMLPGMDGMSVCRELRANPETKSAAIVILTAKSDPDDVVAGLDSGANDYIAKPFLKEVLLARIRAALRKSTGSDEKRLSVDGLVLDNTTHRVMFDGTELKLTLTEYRILELLLRSKGRVFGRSYIIDRLSDGEKVVTERTIDVQMVGLRRKLGTWAKHIETIRGVGYRLNE